MNYGLEDFTYHPLDEAAYPESRLEPIPVLRGQTLDIDGTARVPVRILERGTEDNDTPEEIDGLLLKNGEEIRVECDIQRQLVAPVAAGEQVGTIRYIFQDRVYREEHIVTGETVRRIDYRWCFRQILRFFLL